MLHRFALCTLTTSLALALGSPHPHPPALTTLNRGIKVPPELRASTRREYSGTSGVFNPKEWFSQDSSSPRPESPPLPGTHIKPAPGSCAALSKVYVEMGGTLWTNRSGWAEGSSDSSASPMPCCSWHGVLCKGNVISTLDLSSNGLSGSLSPVLFTLPGLENLNLHSNSISGPIPDGFDALPKLKSFDVSNNSLTDSIPASLAAHSALSSLRLTANRLTGFVDFSGPSLSNIFINQNSFSGMAMSQMGPLQRLVANNNQIKGPLLDFSGATNMRIFSVANNSFAGDLFDLHALELLERFDVRNNAISGPLPRDISSLSHLTYFNVGGNRLSGAFPNTRAPSSLITCAVLPNDFQTLPSQDSMDDIRSLASRCLHRTTPPSATSGGKDGTRPVKSGGGEGTSHRRANVIPVQLAPPPTTMPPIVPEASRIPLPSGVQNTPIPPGAPVPTPHSADSNATSPSAPLSAPAPPMASLYAETTVKGDNRQLEGPDPGYESRIKNESSSPLGAHVPQTACALMVVLGLMLFL